jgi:hypothetical protein
MVSYAMAQGITNRVVARNNATRMFDMNMGKLEIKDEIEAYENNLFRYKARVKEKNDRERREYEEMLELQRNPELALAR